MANEAKLTPHSKKILNLLIKKKQPLTAYEIMHQLSDSGIKAPPTVYRALNNLLDAGLVHRINSINAFIACDGSEEHDHAAQFAVCNSCGGVEEIHDDRINNYIKKLSKEIHFQVKNKILELTGICAKCSN